MMRGGHISNYTADGKRIKASKGVLKPLIKLMMPHIGMLMLCVLAFFLSTWQILPSPMFLKSPLTIS